MSFEDERIPASELAGKIRLHLPDGEYERLIAAHGYDLAEQVLEELFNVLDTFLRVLGDWPLSHRSSMALMAAANSLVSDKYELLNG